MLNSFFQNLRIYIIVKYLICRCTWFIFRWLLYEDGILKSKSITTIFLMKCKFEAPTKVERSADPLSWSKPSPALFWAVETSTEGDAKAIGSVLHWRNIYVDNKLRSFRVCTKVGGKKLKNNAQVQGGIHKHGSALIWKSIHHPIVVHRRQTSSRAYH